MLKMFGGNNKNNVKFLEKGGGVKLTFLKNRLCYIITIM